MDESVTLYKQFIDDLADPLLTSSVHSHYVREWGTDIPKTYTSPETFDRLMGSFTPEQREEIANLLQKAYDSGMFNVLEYLSDEIYLNKMRISVDSIELPVEPFGMTLYEDWIGRKAGDYEWPSTQSPE